MYSWNIVSPTLTGDTKKDIEELYNTIDEMNKAMRVLVTGLKKAEKTE